MSVHHSPLSTSFQTPTSVHLPESREGRINTRLNETIPEPNTSRSLETSDIEMANPAYHGVSVKYALEAVPTFDGKNIPLNHFLEGCEEARDMLPWLFRITNSRNSK